MSVEVDDCGVTHISGVAAPADPAKGIAVNYRLTAMRPGVLLEIPDVGEVTDVVSMMTEDLQDMIKRTAYAAGVGGDTKREYTGVLFELDGEGLTLTALDGFRLAACGCDGIGDGDLRVIIPASALKQAAAIEGARGFSSVAIGEHVVKIFVDENIRIITKLIDGEFMDVRSTVVPQSFAMEVTVSAKALLQAVEGVSAVMDTVEINHHTIGYPVVLEFNPEKRAVGVAYDGSCEGASACVEAEGCLEQMIIAFRPRYLMEALAACGDETVMLCVNDPLHVMMIAPTDGSGWLHGVLPVRYKGRR